MDDLRVGSVVDERYEIHERLAAGGTGVVYRAERIGLAKPVAVKFLHRSSAAMPERQERFRREAEAMSRLAHPNLMSIIDFGEVDGVPYLVMEFLAGESLRDALTRGALEPRRAVFIAYQILAGLGSAHDSGVLHRDLKPGNVLLVGTPGEDLVKILDFGVAKLLDAGEGPTEVSAVAGRVIGTPQYMAPEQARSQTADRRTDVYAVGVILYEMVVGRRPFDGDNDLAVLRQHIEDTPVPPRALRSEISSELDALILRALAKDPDDRWASAPELAAALLELPEGSGVLRLRPTTDLDTSEDEPRDADPAPRTSRGGRRVAILLALLVAMVSGAALAASFGYVDVPALPWSGSPEAPPDAAPDASPPADAAVPDAPPPDAAPPPIPAPIRPYVEFLEQRQTAPADYVLGLFEDHAVVVLCMRSHAESTQYELVTEIVRDPRFVERAGRVVTETGSRSLRRYVARLVRGDEPISDEQLRPVYRNVDDDRASANFAALLRTVQALNVELPEEQRVMVYPAGDRIVRTLRKLEPGSGSLVLATDCDATRRLRREIAYVLLNQMRALAPLAQGRWDAAFELADDRAVGFDFDDSPFGRDVVGASRSESDDVTYAERFTGFVFYEPLRDHRLVAPPPAEGDHDAGPEAPGALTYADVDPEQWEIAQQQIATWLDPAAMTPAPAADAGAAPAADAGAE